MFKLLIAVCGLVVMILAFALAVYAWVASDWERATFYAVVAVFYSRQLRDSMDQARRDGFLK